MENLQDIVDSILDNADDTNSSENMVSEIIVIDVDEIQDNFGATWVYAELVSKRGVGTLAYIYTTLVHPVIAGVFNSCAADDEEQMRKFLNRLSNLRSDEELGNYVHDGLEQRVWELVNSGNPNLLNISTKELLRLCVSIAEIMVVRIRDFALDFGARLPEQQNVKAAIQIDQRCSAQVIPPERPDSLVITLTYGWVYI